MNRKSMFSVVIPTYNREKTICRSVQSVLKQTYPNIELTIVDDGSSDHTKEIVDKFLNIPNVRYIYQNNRGAQSARNRGLRESTGEYIIFLDSDDELLPECLTRMVEKYDEDPELKSVYCLTGIRAATGEINLMRNDVLQGRVYRDVLIQGYLTSSSFISMKRVIFRDIIGWDEQFPASQDDDMCFRIAKKYKIGLVNEILGIYSFEDKTDTRIGNSRRRVADGWWMLWNKFEQDVVEMCGKDVIKKHFKECLNRYEAIGDIEGIDACKVKIEKYM